MRRKFGLSTSVDLIMLASSFGLDVAFLDLSPGLTEALIPEEATYLVVANHQPRWPGRTRFSIARELDHCLLHRHTRKRFLCPRGGRSLDPRQADMSSAELLVPLDEVQGLAQEMAFISLAHHFGMSLEAMDIRLLEVPEAVWGSSPTGLGRAAVMRLSARIVAPLVIPALIFGAIVLAIQSGERRAANRAADRATQGAAESVEVDQVIAGLAAKWNAVTDWKGETGWRYTLDAQEALIKAENRPLLVQGSLLDVAREDQGDATHSDPSPKFKAWFQSGWPSQVYFELEVTEETARALVQKDRARDPLFGYSVSLALIVYPSGVYRPTFTATAQAIDQDEASLILDASENVFVITGRLADFADPAD